MTTVAISLDFLPVETRIGRILSVIESELPDDEIRHLRYLQKQFGKKCLSKIPVAFATTIRDYESRIPNT